MHKIIATGVLTAIAAIGMQVPASAAEAVAPPKVVVHANGTPSGTDAKTVCADWNIEVFGLEDFEAGSFDIMSGKMPLFEDNALLPADQNGYTKSFDFNTPDQYVVPEGTYWVVFTFEDSKLNKPVRLVVDCSQQ